MTSLTEVYDLFLASSGAIIDSRKTEKNTLFFALKGPNFDGNTYAIRAIENGAYAAVVDDPEIAAKNHNCYLVEDVLTTLQDLGHHHRTQFNIPVIGLTGSNGKTTTKELIAAVLRTKHSVLATEGNLNNHIGVPLTLLNIDATHSHALIEMGANHIGEIDFLCRIAQPNHGLITNIGKAHLEGFGSMQGVLKGKTELYNYLKERNGTVFINNDDKKLIEASKENNTIHYYPATFTILEEQPTLKLRHNHVEIHTHLVGHYNTSNIAAAIAVGTTFGVPTQKSVEAICTYVPENLRSQLLIQNNKTIVLDAYNANPTSMHVAIIAFNKRKGKKALILGAMAELGAYEEIEHKSLVAFVNELNINACYWVGEAFKNHVTKNWFATSSELESHFKKHPLETESVLIKGSRSIGLEKIIPSL